MSKITSGFAAALIIIVYCLMGLYHIWTAILVFSNYGTFWGILALCAPILTELFMNGVYISSLGIFNTYTLTILGIFILYGIASFLASKSK